MKKKYNEDELDSMVDFISDYISSRECNEEIVGNDMNWKTCDYIGDCYITANNRCNSEYAESIDYGGYDSEEEFWEQLFD